MISLVRFTTFLILCIVMVRFRADADDAAEEKEEILESMKMITPFLKRVAELTNMGLQSEEDVNEMKHLLDSTEAPLMATFNVLFVLARTRSWLIEGSEEYESLNEGFQYPGQSNTGVTPPPSLINDNPRVLTNPAWIEVLNKSAQIIRRLSDLTSSLKLAISYGSIQAGSVMFYNCIDHPPTQILVDVRDLGDYANAFFDSQQEHRETWMRLKRFNFAKTCQDAVDAAVLIQVCHGVTDAHKDEQKMQEVVKETGTILRGIAAGNGVASRSPFSIYYYLLLIGFTLIVYVAGAADW